MARAVLLSNTNNNIKPKKIRKKCFKSMTRARHSDTAIVEVDLGHLHVQNGKSKALKIHRSTHLLEYHRTFLNLCYFLLIIPFRLVQVNRHGYISYDLHSSPLQKILCGLVQILIIFEYTSIFRLFSWDEIDGTPMSYLHVATVFASFLYAIFFIFVFWTKIRLFRSMFKDLQRLEFAYNPSRRCGLKIRLLSIAFCLFAVLVALTDPMIHDGFLIREDFSNISKKFACRARSYYLFKPCPRHLPNYELPENESFLDHAVTWVHLLVSIPNLIMVHIVDVAVVLTAICMWHVLTYFIKDSKLDSTSSEKALVHYEVLKKLVKSMNAAVGLLTFSAIAVSLPFYASWGAIVFNDSKIDWLYLIHVSTYFLNFFTILAFGADFNFKVGKFYGRLSVPEICEGISPNRLTSLLMDMHSNQISVRGCGFFIMTYRFFGTILSLIATYSIIILQFQFSRRNMSNVNCSYIGGMSNFRQTLLNSTTTTTAQGRHSF